MMAGPAEAVDEASTISKMKDEKAYAFSTISFENLYSYAWRIDDTQRHRA